MRISDWSSDVCSSDLTAFDARYKGAALSGSQAAMVANAEARWNDSVGAFQDAMKVQAGVVTNMGVTRQSIGTLVSASPSATGALQAAQAGNQILEVKSQQPSDVTAPRSETRREGKGGCKQ